MARTLLRLAALLAGFGALCVPAAQAAPASPSSDPFYSYGGNLNAAAPGTVLRTRKVEISLAGSPRAYPATQVLYRTTDQLGEPSATVATIIRPASASLGLVKLLSYQTFYDGVASTCRPSYTLQGGDPSNTTAGIDESLMLDYVQQGFTVVTSDYEGPTDDYGAGHESGYGTLDAIRAAEHELGLSASAPVGLVGYSGGSIASEWASELQPSYAPELHLIGIAEGGIPVHYVHNLHYIDGSSTWAGAIPAVAIGIMRAYKLDVNKYASPEGLQIYKQVEQGCLNPSAYPGLHFADLLKPRYKDWEKVPIFVKIFNASIMSEAGTPREPLLMAVGNADGTGDGVMVAKDVQELAYIYCQRHVSVQLNIYNGDNHDEAAAPFESTAVPFLEGLYSGQSVANDCASVGPGNPLTPLPNPPAAKARAPRIELHSVRVNRRLHGLAVVLSTDQGTVRRVVVELKRGRRVVAKRSLAVLGHRRRRVVLRVHGRVPPRGRYTLVVLVRRTRALRHAVRIRR